MNPPTEDREELWSCTRRLEDELEAVVPLEKCTGEKGKELLLRRRELQAELEINYHRLSELEVLDMVDIIKQSALDSGLADRLEATQETGPCPLCLDDIPTTFATNREPHFHRVWCCGAILCSPCLETRNKWMDQVKEDTEELWRTIENEGSVDQFRCQEVLSNLSISTRCPFCRATAPSIEDEDLAFCLQPNAEAGKTWAQFELGKRMIEGEQGISRDRWKAAEWLELAANDGNVQAMTLLAELWGKGFPEMDIAPSKDKEKELYQRAARQGYFRGQYFYGNMLGSIDESIMWHVLSAAQGFAGSQYQLGMLYYVNDPRIKDASVFKAIYWLKKAALQGDPHAQMVLVGAVLEAKSILFDSRDDIVGHSAIPEACFWFDLARTTFPAKYGSVPRPDDIQLNRCGRCGEHEGVPVRLRACTKCQGIKYCGRDCQVAHWKIGHKRDCLVVEACREALTLPSNTPTPPS